MAKYQVRFSAPVEVSVEVEIPDGLDADEAREVAIEAAYEDLPGGLCTQCSGYKRSWSRDIGYYELAESQGDDSAVERVE